MHAADADIKQLFARHGIRCTKQRVEVYRALASTDSHPTAEELFWSARECEASMSLATVYNALEAFCAAGLCRKIALCAGGARFDADLRNHPHVVTADGRVFDVSPDLGARLVDAIPRHLLAEVERQVGAPIQRVRVEFDCEAPCNGTAPG
jgi:Fe2+ or Zn2+ uptake regulation protein